MGGKAALLLVLGFSTIFLVKGNNINRVVGSSIENFERYYVETQAHNIAISGANMAANDFFINNNWAAGISELDFEGGKINAEIAVVDTFQDIRRITVTGNFAGLNKVVSITVRPSKFSKFGYYTISEGTSIYWTSRDTVWGPFHTQDKIKIDGNPVFYGKVTTLKGRTTTSGSKPKYYGGYETGVNNPMPVNGVEEVKTKADVIFSGQDTVIIEFNKDKINYKFKANDPYVTADAATLAPNGVIFCENAVVRLKGTVSGKYTLATSGTSSGKGSVWLDDNIKYNKNPLTDPTSQDMLGIVAKNNIWVTNNTPNKTSIEIDAAMYCEQGSFGAQDPTSGGARGSIKLLGGITQNVRGQVSTYNSSHVVTNGYTKQYRYDNRLMLAAPPVFPGTGKFEIISWLE